MPITTYKTEVLGRSCISSIVELPIRGEAIYVPKDGEVIEQITIGEVKGHPNMVTVAVIISQKDSPYYKAKNNA